MEYFLKIWGAALDRILLISRNLGRLGFQGKARGRDFGGCFQEWSRFRVGKKQNSGCYKKKVYRKLGFWAETSEMPAKWAQSGVQDTSMRDSNCPTVAQQVTALKRL